MGVWKAGPGPSPSSPQVIRKEGAALSWELLAAQVPHGASFCAAAQSGARGQKTLEDRGFKKKKKKKTLDSTGPFPWLHVSSFHSYLSICSTGRKISTVSVYQMLSDSEEQASREM